MADITTLKPTIEARAAPRFVKADYGASPDGSPTYTPGDHIVLLDGQGAPSLYHINDIDDAGQMNCEKVDSDLQPTGDTLTRAMSDSTGLGLDPSHFAALQPLYMINEGGADDYSMKATADFEELVLAYCKAATADPTKFAYTPDKDHPSTWKLPIGDAKHIKLAWQAVTKGMMGAKAKVGSALDSVKRKIKSAANALPAGDVKKAVLAYINGKTAAKATKAVDSTPAVLVRERNVALKSLDENGNRVGGYLVLWGDKEHTDVDGDWFTRNTDFKLDWYDKRPALYEHTKNQKVQATKVGTIDVLEPDDVGLWMEAELERSNRYMQAVKKLIDQRKCGLSSGCMVHTVQRSGGAKTGEITVWPIGEGSITVTPAEPRTIGISLKHYSEPQTIETAYKSMGLLADKLLDGTEQEPVTDECQHSASDGDDPGDIAASDVNGNETKSNKQVEETMTKEEMTAIATLVVDMQREAAKSAPAAPVAAEPPANGTNGGSPTKSLPASGGATLPAAPAPSVPPAPVPSNRPMVIGDRRYSYLNAEDMSIYVDLMGGVMDRVTMKQQLRSRNAELKPLEAAAVKFYQDLEGDPDHKLQRMICDKTLRGIAQKQIDPEVADFLPFATKAAVDGNFYDGEAVKAARMESIAVKMTDAGKDAQEIQQALKSFNPNATKSNELDNTGQSNFGAEWVPTIWNNQAWRRIRINNVIASQIFSIQMPSNPWNWPIESTDPTVFYVAEGTDAAQLVLGSGNTLALSKAGTGKVTFTAKKLGAHIGFSVEENEDSIIPIIPLWKYQVTRALANFVDDTLINGDTVVTASTNINLIDGTPAAGTSYLAMDGLRKYCLLTNTGQLVDFGNAFPTVANMRVMQGKLLAAYQADFTNLMYVTNVGTWQRMKAMPEFASYMVSGVSPTQITGLLPMGSPNQVGSETTPAPVGYLDGIPIYVSAQINLSKSGAIGSNGGEISTTGSNNVDGSILLLHRSRAVLGWRRAIGVDVLATSVFSDTFQMWGTTRFALNTFDTQSVALGYDIAQ